MTVPIKSKTVTAAHTEPNVIAKFPKIKLPEVCCEGSVDTVKLGLGWAERSGTVELRQDGSGTNAPEPSTVVQAKGIGVIWMMYVYTYIWYALIKTQQDIHVYTYAYQFLRLSNSVEEDSSILQCHCS